VLSFIEYITAITALKMTSDQVELHTVISYQIYLY